MKVEVTTLTRRGGTPIRRSHTVEAERLRIGRAPDSEVRLEDLRIELLAASLSQRGSQLTIDRLGSAPVLVNGRPVETSALRAGDTIDVGPCRIQIAEPPADLAPPSTMKLRNLPAVASPKWKRQPPDCKPPSPTKPPPPGWG